MPNNESIHDRITQLVNEFGGGKNTTFASITGSSEANVRGYRATVMPKYDFLEKIARSFDIDLKWLLTGEGSMLCNRKNLEETTIGDVPNSVPISPAEESIIYNMYKDEKADWKAEKKELKEQIDQLQTELREKSEELAVLKAKHEPDRDHGRPLHDIPDSPIPRKGLGL